MSDEQQLHAVTPKKRGQGQNLNAPEKTAAQDTFIESFSEHGNVMLACKYASVTRTTLYRWKEKPQFLKLYNAALEDAKDNMRAEIYRRGKEGYEEDVWQLGKYCGKITKYSDTLLIFHAKMLMPEYREKQQLEVTGKDGGPVQQQQTIMIDPRSLSSEQLGTLKALALEMKQSEGT